MSLTKTMTYGYGVSADYDLLNLEIYLSKLKIALSDLPLLDFLESFASDSGFTYDSAKSEFVAGKLQAKSQRPANATFGINYSVNQNATWGDGNLAGILVGAGASVAGGKLTISGTTSFAYYASASNMNIQQVGAIKFKFTPSWSGNPSMQSFLFNSGGTDSPYKNQIAIFHTSTGGLYVNARNNTGAIIFSRGYGTWSPIAGTTYEIEFNLDVTTGASRLFIDGTQFGVTETATGTRDLTDCTIVMIGNSATGTYGAAGSYDDIIFYDAVQHTSNYTPGYTLPEYDYITNKVVCPEMHYTGHGTLQALTNFVATVTGAVRFTIQIGRSGVYLYWNGSAWATSNETYAQSNDKTTFLAHVAALDIEGEVYGQFMVIFPDSNSQCSIDEMTTTVTGQQYETGHAQTNDGFNVSAISAFIQSAVIPAGDSILYALYFNSKYYYWSGTAWAESDLTPAKLNTAAQIDSNLASLTFAANATVYLYVYMASFDGTTTPELDSNVFTYEFGGIKPTDPETCYVWGYVLGPDITPIEGATITVELNIKANEYCEAAKHLIGGVATATTDANGYWIIELIRSSEFEGAGEYVFGYKKGTTWERNKLSGAKMILTVPDSDNVNVAELFEAAA